VLPLCVIHRAFRLVPRLTRATNGKNRHLMLYSRP
jgi:hypothetical protein